MFSSSKNSAINKYITSKFKNCKLNNIKRAKLS